MKNLKKTQITAVDLFCGAGGLTKGLINSGIMVKAGIDIDESCKYPYTTNNHAKFIQKSITDISPAELIPFYSPNSLKLLAGCAPCQTFSKYNHTADTSDERWWLLLEFARLISSLQPDLVTMENVPELAKHSVFEKFLLTLIENKYFVSWQIIHCEDYGIPQHRSRLVLLASKLDKIELLLPEDCGFNKKRTVKDAIGKLPKLNAGETNKKDILHHSAALSEKNLNRIRASKPGGTWRDWPEELIADCHKKKSGKTYPSVYGRMEWDKQSPTITTQFYNFGTGRFGHPEQDRALSLREGAILQTFPSDYKFVDPNTSYSFNKIARLIGNAVPVKVGEIIGKSFKEHLKHLGYSI